MAWIRLRATSVVGASAHNVASTLGCCATRASLTWVEIAMSIQIDDAAINGVTIIVRSDLGGAGVR